MCEWRGDEVYILWGMDFTTEKPRDKHTLRIGWLLLDDTPSEVRHMMVKVDGKMKEVALDPLFSLGRSHN